MHNNYVVPNIIRIVNKADIIFGSIAYSLFAFMYADAEREELIGTYLHLATGLFLLFETFVGLCKMASYIACAVKGYKVSIFGSIFYALYILVTFGLSIVYLGGWIVTKI